jgi:hypothetical protein
MDTGTTLIDYNSGAIHIVSLPLSVYDSKAGTGSAANWDSVIVPLSLGEQWIWKDSSSLNSVTIPDGPNNSYDTSSILHWVVSDTLPDSAGWIRRHINEDTTNFEIEQYNQYGELVNDVERQPTDTSHFNLRYQPSSSTLVIVPTSKQRQILASGFFLDGTEISISRGIWTRSGLTMDSAVGPVKYKSISTSRSEFYVTAETDTYVSTLTLLDREPPPPQDGIKAHPSRIEDSKSLADELEANPNARLEIMDASGRLQQLNASDAFRLIPTIHGVRMIRLDLPDRTLSGMILLP